MLLIRTCYLKLQQEGILSKININKAPGVDNLPARILRTCAKKLSIPLAHLFNLSLRTGKMPTLWKSANITPIHKGDSRELVTSYRSISLLPIPAKCLERIVHSAIYDHVSPFLTEWQHGFIKDRSCETQLILTHHQWATALDKGKKSWCSLFRLFQSLWQSEPCSFVANVVQLWDHWLITTMVWKLFKQSPTESSARWYILFLVRCLIWSSSGLFIRAFIFYIYTFYCSLRENTPSLAWNGDQYCEDTFISAKIRTFGRNSDSITISAF